MNENWSEEKIQQELYIWFNNEYKEYRKLLHHLYSNPRNAVQGRMLASIGLVKGYPDLQLNVAKKGFNGLFLELKRPGEKPRKEQLEIMELLEAQGYFVAWSSDLEEMKDIIKNYLND